ncbi:hypothetical protein FRB99_000437, partial [Tulasnella sp. 403]
MAMQRTLKSAARLAIVLFAVYFIISWFHGSDVGSSMVPPAFIGRYDHRQELLDSASKKPVFTEDKDKRDAVVDAFKVKAVHFLQCRARAKHPLRSGHSMLGGHT